MNNSIPTNVAPIAFFCAEYAIEDTLPIYAGGLGILAGDYVREAGDDGVPLYAIGLFYRGGVASNHPSRHELDPQAAGFELLPDENDEPLTISVGLSGRQISVQAWSKPYGSARLILLDTDVATNSDVDRTITHYLYDPDLQTSLMQQLILGLAGIRILERLGIEPGVYHLNEGHMAFIVLGLVLAHLEQNPNLTMEQALAEVTPQIVATKHTILSAAGIKIDHEQFVSYFGPLEVQYRIDVEKLFKLGTTDTRPHLFSTTQFLLQHAIRANSVSVIHAKFEHDKHPESQLIPITNGVYAPRWMSDEWTQTPADDTALWQLRSLLRGRLIDYTNNTVGSSLSSDALTIVWARRITAYKRPGLIISDLAKLASILGNADRPVQIIISGKPSAQDLEAQRTMQNIIRFSQLPELKDKLVFLPDYNPSSAKLLVSGADVWLNTPLVGQEASGTSGMKAALNGALQFSTADGWIPEVDWTDRGWILPNDHAADELYSIINTEIAPLFYDSELPANWISRIRQTRQIALEHYTTERMLREYIVKLYYPS